jgi:hypothetical protein
MAEINLKFWQDNEAFAYPVTASTKIEKGHHVGINPATGYAREFQFATDIWMGIAAFTADNSAGTAGDIDVVVYRKGLVEHDVNGSGITKNGAVVYAKDNSVFDVTGSVAVGQIEKWISGTTCIVRF